MAATDRTAIRTGAAAAVFVIVRAAAANAGHPVGSKPVCRPQGPGRAQQVRVSSRRRVDGPDRSAARHHRCTATASDSGGRARAA
jgi:hypothetical protein